MVQADRRLLTEFYIPHNRALMDSLGTSYQWSK